MLSFCLEESAPVIHAMEKGKKCHKTSQIIASLIQGREHKEKWTSFYLLPDLCPLCFSCRHVKQQTSVGSLCLTRIELSRTYSTTMLLIVDQDLLIHHAVDLLVQSDTSWKVGSIHFQPCRFAILKWFEDVRVLVSNSTGIVWNDVDMPM